MTTDERIGRALHTIADDLRPQPDPYGRLLARRRRADRRRVAGLAAAFLVVALGVAATARTWTMPDPPPPGQSEMERQFANTNAWAAELADGPTHGAVGADAAFVADLSAGMMRNWRDGWYDAERLSVDRVTVPFVDDVGPYRIALVVLVLTEPDERKWPFAHAWLYGTRGADAATLVAGAERVSHGLEPYAHTEYGTVEGPVAYVAVVPPRCRFGTTTTPADPRWAPEPTGSYIVRTQPTAQPEWWQVDCGADVRVELPAPNRQGLPEMLTEAQLDEILAGVRTQVDRTVARQCVRLASRGYPSVPVAGLPALVWLGDYTDTRPVTAGEVPRSDRAAVTVTPLDRGGWAVQLLIGWSIGTLGWSPSQRFTVAGDPTRPDTTFVLRPHEEEPTYLVVPPAGAASVRALRGGTPVGAAPVVGGAARLEMSTPFDVVEALGPNGAVLGRGAPARPMGGAGIIDRWGEN